VGIETIPPLSLGAIRFFVAGLTIALLSIFVGEESLSRDELRLALLSGVLLMSSNGIVCSVELTVPSAIVAIFLGTTPIYMLLIAWMFFHGPPPSLQKIVGALIGAYGIAILTIDSETGPVGTNSSVSFVLLFISCLLWTFGSLIPRRLVVVQSKYRFVAFQMLAGGVALAVFSFIFERPLSHNWASVSFSSWVALAYLIIFGSILAFSAYTWLSRNVETHLVSSYALVNPIVAVLLGGLFLGEHVGPNAVSASVLVIGGLGLLVIPAPPRALVARIPQAERGWRLGRLLSSRSSMDWRISGKPALVLIDRTSSSRRKN